MPNVEVVIKSSKDGFIETETDVSSQGEYQKPVSLAMSNTVPGSPAYWIAIVKENQKALGTYVPVSDRVMWKDGLVAGMTVPGVNHPDKPVDITKAYYNNDSRCCYTLADKLAPSETEDLRENLAWNRAIGANIITSDDTDSIDTYYDKKGQLDKVAMPYPRYPLSEMHSTLSWDLGYFKKPVYSVVNVKGWKGYSGATWNWKAPVCLWDNPYQHYAWMFSCDAGMMYNYYNKLQTRVVETENHDAAIQLFFHDKEYCLSAKDGYKSYYKWVTDCSPGNSETHFQFTPANHLKALYFDKDISYTEFDDEGYYYGVDYGVLRATKTPDAWAEWVIEPAK